MEFGEIFHILRARLILLLCSVISVVFIASAYRYVFPGQFKAVASVIVDPRGINPVSGVATQESMAQDSVLGTYANIARSEGIARRVFLQLPQSVQTKLKNDWLTSHSFNSTVFESWAARRIMKDVDVRAGGQSSHVLDISVSSRDPDDAAASANAYAKALIQYSREMRIAAARKDADYFKIQAGTLREQTEEAETRLSAFQRVHGITSVDDKTDVETGRLAALSSQAIVNQDLSYDAASKARQAMKAAPTAEALNNGLVQALATELADREAKYRQLSVRLGANHPDMITARAQVDQARQALNRETKNVADSLIASSIAARSRAESLRLDSEQQRKKVIEINSLRVQLSSLDKDVQQKRKLYEAALQRSTETGLEAGSQHEDLLLLTEAFPPDDRAGPGAGVLLPLAVIVGLLVGMLFSIVLARVKPKFHRLIELEDLGIPILQVIPVSRLPVQKLALQHRNIG